MIELALDTEEQMKRMATGPMGNPAQQLKAAPLQKSVAEEMGNMAKQRAMSGALDMGTEALMSGSAAPVVGSAVESGAMLGPMAGSGAMTAIGTAMPYVGAGLLAGKAFGLFSDGGFVGPLSPQYAADGDKIDRNKQYTKDQQMNNYKEMIRQQMYNKSIMGQNPTRGINKADAARAAFTTDPIMSKIYGVGKAPSDSGMYDLSVFQGLFPIDDKGYTARGYSSGGNVEVPKPKPEASELFKEIQKKYIENDPYGSDTTSSPFDMLRSDNAPST